MSDCVCVCLGVIWLEGWDSEGESFIGTAVINVVILFAIDLNQGWTDM